MEYFNILPLDITLDILTRLPAESVLECKVVSKTWYTLVSHHPASFSKMHLHHLNNPSASAHGSGKLGYIALTAFGRFYYFQYNENHESSLIEKITRINLPPPWNTPIFLGSCNGLICLARPPYLNMRTHVYNPITREYVRLPKFSGSSDLDYFYWTNGFGYVSSSNEYKVVAIVNVGELVEAYIYTLGSGKGWRNLGELKIENGFDDWEQAGVFANEAHYWKDIELKMITTFDLAQEKFRENLSPPPLPLNTNWRYHKIGVLDGVLFFAAYRVVEDAEYFDIWLFHKKNDSHDKKEGEEHQSWGWTKEFRVDEKANY